MSELRLQANEVLADGTVKSGMLIAAQGAYQYPIVNAIPRFVGEEHYANSFGYEWRKWPKVQFESENTGTAMAGHTERMFRTITGFTMEQLDSKLVVEFGCGPGRFLDVVRRSGGIAVGIDMSIAVEAARENFKDDHNVLVVQGDILNPPFKKSRFDVGYTIGVLHHTPDPAGGFKNLVGVLKDGAPVACCVYSKDGFYDFPSVARYRRLHNATKSLFGNKLALGYSYFSAYLLYHGIALMNRIRVVRRLVPPLERHVLVNLDIPSAKWRLLDIFDAITPYYASTHTREDVRSWFDEANCREVTETSWDGSFTGIKGR